MALNVGSRLGHYDVTALIGEGGMGQVYQATDTKLNRELRSRSSPKGSRLTHTPRTSWSQSSTAARRLGISTPSFRILNQRGLTMACVLCGRETAADAAFCQHCGADQRAGAGSATGKRFLRRSLGASAINCCYPALISSNQTLRLDIQCQRAASVKIGWKYLDD